MADVTARMLQLLASLQSGRGFSGEELAARLGVSLRTLRRDVERLRSYGYPVDTKPGPGGHYRLAAGRALPPLTFDDEESVAVLLGVAIVAAADARGSGGLADAATRVYGTLDQFLPRRLRPAVTALRASLETSRFGAPDVDAGLLAAVAEAISTPEAITFDYRTADGSDSRRRIEPYRQVYLHLRWYVLGWDLAREDWRTFRVDRMSGLMRTGARFAQRELPARSALEYLREGMHAARRRVRFVTGAPPARIAELLTYEGAELEALGPEGTRVTMWLDSWERLLVPLAMLGTDLRIEEPAEFRERLAVFARRLQAAVADPGTWSDAGD